MGLFKSNNPFRHSGKDTDDNVDDVGPPLGPPPSYTAHAPDTKGSNGGSGSGNGNGNDDGTAYAPPPGPPPSRVQHDDDYVAPPPGPPPSQHNWQSVPLPEDTSNYPPPPDIFTGHDRSWAHNATEAQAEEGERWCRRYPLLVPAAAAHLAPRPGAPPPPRPVVPNANTFSGTIVPAPTSANVWRVRTDRRAGDCCVTVQPASYLAARDDPRLAAAAAGRGTKTVYFEVRVTGRPEGDAGVAVGFAALPYPPFRMPGWHRGSLAVHSDDGHRYVNDRWGGKDFVRPWGVKGVTVGVGMKFSAAAAAGGIEVECFFTRDGVLEGSWDVNEERDAQKDLEPLGVQGFHDLVAAVGTYEKTEFEIVLDPARWLYRVET